MLSSSHQHLCFILADKITQSRFGKAAENAAEKGRAAESAAKNKGEVKI